MRRSSPILQLTRSIPEKKIDELVKEYTRPELVGYRRFPLAVRVLFLLLDNVPAVRRMERPLVYRF